MATALHRSGDLELLSAPAGLDAATARKIAVELNALIAEAFALFVKTKNFHWRMSDPESPDHHLLLDEQAEQIYATIDPMADSVRQLRQIPLRSIGQVAAEPRFDDGDADFLSPREMLPNLVADNVAFADSMRTIYEICREAGDYGTAGMLEVYIDECERRARFLYEASYED